MSKRIIAYSALSILNLIGIALVSVLAMGILVTILVAQAVATLSERILDWVTHGEERP